MSLPKSAGDPPNGVLPSSMRRDLIRGSLSAALTSLLSLVRCNITKISCSVEWIVIF